MRIAIINITGGRISGGYRKYLLNTIPRMAQHSEVEALLCFSPESLNIESWFGTLKNVQFKNCLPFRVLRFDINRNLKRPLEKFRPDVLFIPTPRYFQFDNVPAINMIQNMEPFAFSSKKNPFSERVKNFLRKKITCKVLCKCARVIATSKFVKDFLVDNLHIPDSKIEVVYYGIAEDNENAKFVRPSVIPRGWKNQFLFTAGSIRPARGLEDILCALNHLARKKFNINLIIAGPTSSNMRPYRKTLEIYITRNKLVQNVIWAEYLNESEMNWCYRNCRAVVMTSRVEAFGLIALEAMSKGCICISAENPCMPEIFGNAAVLYPPCDSKALAKIIHDVFAWDNSRLKEMASKAKIRSAKFSWDRTVEQTITELKMAAESHKQ